MFKQVLIGLAAAIVTLPISFLLLSHAYQVFHPVEMARGSGGEVITSSLFLGLLGAPICAAIVFVLTLYIVYKIDHNADEDDQ